MVVEKRHYHLILSIVLSLIIFYVLQPQQHLGLKEEYRRPFF